MCRIVRDVECRGAGVPIRHPLSQQLAIVARDQLQAALQRTANTIFESRARAPPRLLCSLSTENNGGDIAIGCAGSMAIERDQGISHSKARRCPVPIFRAVGVVTEDLTQSCKTIAGTLEVLKTLNVEDDAGRSHGHCHSVENERECLSVRLEPQELQTSRIDHELSNTLQACQAEIAILHTSGRARQCQGQSVGRPKDIRGGCGLIGIGERSKDPKPQLYGSDGVVCIEQSLCDAGKSSRTVRHSIGIRVDNLDYGVAIPKPIPTLAEPEHNHTG